MRCRVMLALLLAVSVVLGGCQGSHEPDEQAYVMAVGFDKASQPGKIKVSYQIATSAGAKGPGGGSTAGASTNMTIITFDNTYPPDSRNLLKLCMLGCHHYQPRQRRLAKLNRLSQLKR